MSIIAQNKAPELLKSARLEVGFANRCAATSTVPYSPETIGRHERGQTRIDPADMAIYASCYGKPDLLLRYCDECPIGSQLREALKDRDFTLAAIRLTNRLSHVTEIARKLNAIADDGRVNDWEHKDFVDVIRDFDTIVTAFEELKLWAFTSGTLTPEEIKEAVPAPTGSTHNQNTY